MLKKVGELKVNKQVDYHQHQVEALERCGYTLILDHEDYFTAYYDVATKILDEKEGEKNESDHL